MSNLGGLPTCISSLSRYWLAHHLPRTLPLLIPFLLSWWSVLPCLKELVEDWRRKQQEKEVNNQEVMLYGDGIFGDTEWKNLKVGDIVRVEKNEFFPADLILLSSSNTEAIFYVETMNLDGETNLKLKQALDVTSNLHECSSFQDFYAVLRCEGPNANLYSFAGNLDLGEQQYPLTSQQLLLRDSKLRNTDYIHGVVIFTGHDTKVMQNSTAPPSKRSRIEKRMDNLVYSLFLSLLSIALIGSLWFGIATRENLEDGRMTRWYLRPNETTVWRPFCSILSISSGNTRDGQ